MCWGCKHRCCFLSSLLRSLEVIACCPLKNVQILADQELLSCQRGQQKCWMCNFILYTLPLEVYRVFWNPWNRADEPNWSTLIYIFFTIFFDAIFSCILKSLQSSFNSECVPLDFFFSLIVRFLRGAVGLKKKKKLVLQLLLSNLKTSDVILEKMTECCMLPLTLFLFISFVPLDSGDHLCMNLPASSFSQLRPLLAASGMLK